MNLWYGTVISELELRINVKSRLQRNDNRSMPPMNVVFYLCRESSIHMHLKKTDIDRKQNYIQQRTFYSTFHNFRFCHLVRLFSSKTRSWIKFMGIPNPCKHCFFKFLCLTYTIFWPKNENRSYIIRMINNCNSFKTLVVL